MKMRMDNIQHIFYICGENHFKCDYSNGLINNENIIFFNNINDMFENASFKNNSRMAEKIIISGLFGGVRKLLCLNREILSKTYIQFWGGDFYVYRNVSFKPVLFLRKQIVRKLIKKSAAIINLIEGDYEKILKIFHIKSKKNFVASMPADPMIAINYAEFREKQCTNRGKLRILIGNSATEENMHEEAFNMVEHLKGDIEVVCPLSYGKENYRDYIVKIGNEKFGDSFIAVTDYCEKKRYVEILNDCDVAIFNNSRQQAMGNITIMMKLGKKIYIRDDTPMWGEMKNRGCHVYNVRELKDITMTSLQDFPDACRNNNIEQCEKRANVSYEQWMKVFND